MVDGGVGETRRMSGQERKKDFLVEEANTGRKDEKVGLFRRAITLSERVTFIMAGNHFMIGFVY